LLPAAGTGTIINATASAISLQSAIAVGGILGVNGIDANGRAGDASTATIASGTLVNYHATGSTLTSKTTTIAGFEKYVLVDNAGTRDADIFLGGSSAESVTAGAGTDYLDGGAGNDTLLGGAAADTILGGAGNDSIDGGASAAAADSLTGGAGNDTLVFATRAEAIGNSAAANTTTLYMDKVTDFVVGTDIIKLGTGAAAFGTGIIFTSATAVNFNTVTALGNQTYNDFAALAAAVESARTGVASTSATAQAYVVTAGTITTASGFTNKTFLVINDNTGTIAATDTWIELTGIDTTTLTTGSFAFG
jgi:hypothetical protein